MQDHEPDDLPPLRWSFRGKVLVAFLALGGLTLAVAMVVATNGAADALSAASYEKLAVARETRKQAVEKWFEDLSNHVLVLSSNESVVEAVAQFAEAWPTLPSASERERTQLENWYTTTRAPFFPNDPQVQALQFHLVASRAKELRDVQRAAPELGVYAHVHDRFHPGLLRYQSAFGLYDLFLIDAPSGRVLYTVLKETDLGASLVEPPFQDTALARVYRRALEPSASVNPVVIEDFTLYPASGIPAAFLAAPIFRAGAAVGVLVIQVSIDELNRVMTGDRQWRAAGLGDTGQTYIVGYDGRFRSDVREQLERPVEFLEHLRVSVDAATVESVRHDRTEVIHLKVPDDARAQIQSRRTETSLGRDFFARPVLRSQTPLRVPGLDWMVVAELSVDEAFAPVSALRTRMLKVSGALALLFFATASMFSRKVTGPLRALTLAARKVGTRAFNTRVAVLTGDELGQLAATFNDMAERLERTTVSREQLEWLAGRLMASQEEERARIARELHDDFAQRFAAVSMDLATLERTTDTDARQSLGQRIKTSVATLSNDLRQLSRLLHPSILDDLGLVAAIESECRLTGERGLAVHFEHEGDIEGLSKEAQLTLYRIIQEGLHNTMRHAHARSATVRLRRNNRVHLELHDDGQGFLREDPAWTPGLGLLSMEERTRLLGGQLKISSAPGLGTHLVVELPR